MILDETLEFGDALAVGTGAADLLFGDVVDLGVARDIGETPLFLVIQVTTTFTGDATLIRFSLASDAAAAIAVDGTESEHIQIGPFLSTAVLTAGSQFIAALPPKGGAAPYERFLGLIVERNGTTGITAGAINAFLTRNASAYTSFPDAVN